MMKPGGAFVRAALATLPLLLSVSGANARAPERGPEPKDAEQRRALQA